ncbi:MAG TPA: ferric reductase-like transmembrane domain-containing protein [Deltaproteobacteria bacterium]|nr:ferric reductase-like transmembrane domain-containing protein [Deltaproteobacteria bacterium]HOI07542.1 ferric reductase-like transmembrane domain-containing protein [Deltaproteobacteria bacterium]
MAVAHLAGRGKGWALLFMACYAAVVLLPMTLADFRGSQGGNPLLVLGLSFALAGFPLLALQAVLAARLRGLEMPFGLDIILRFHRNMGIFALALFLTHPVLLALAGGGLSLLAGTGVSWPIWLGRLTLLLLLVNVMLSAFQTRLGISFERWRAVHDVLGPLIILFAFVHSMAVGEDLGIKPLWILWLFLFAAAVVLFVFHRILRPLILKNEPYRVTGVKQEVPGVWTVTLSPLEGRRVNPYLPGQFHFITFYRDRDLPTEEHHWTISSSPAQDHSVSSTIKALGDFTSTMGETRAGDRAAVHGAFGRFSHLLHPTENDLVFVAGGIGITPLMSMLRYMQDTGDGRNVLLLYANRDEDGIVFRDELARITAGGRPKLTVVHVLSTPGRGWTGETGYVDADMIRKYCSGDLAAKAFYLCGPPGMLEALTKYLKAMGVPGAKIRTEIFSFLD